MPAVCLGSTVQQLFSCVGGSVIAVACQVEHCSAKLESKIETLYLISSLHSVMNPACLLPYQSAQCVPGPCVFSQRAGANHAGPRRIHATRVASVAEAISNGSQAGPGNLGERAKQRTRSSRSNERRENAILLAATLVRCLNYPGAHPAALSGSQTVR